MRENGSEMKEEEHRFYFSKKMKIVLFSLLIGLNIILRIPFYPHESGADTFVMHILANSVSQFGHARWWINPLSVVELYPYSECSAVPFIISGISQSTGIDTERTIFLFCMIIGLLCIFSAYIMAGMIFNDDLFKFSVAFSLSISPAVLNYMVWSITARTPFIALLPLFVYSLLKCRTYKRRFSLLTFILFALLFATHHLAYFLIPIFIGYFIVITAYGLKNNIGVKSVKFRMPKYVPSALIAAGFFIMFAIPFQTGRLIMEFGSRYEAVNMLFFSNLPRYVGVLGIFAVGGLVYLLFKSDKGFGEWTLLLILMFLTPFLYVQTYMKWFIPCFISLLIGVGIINIARAGRRGMKYALIILVIFLLLAVSFSGFYQHWRTKGGIHLFDGYMKESTYIAGKWIKEYIDGSLICNDRSSHIFAVSGIPLFAGSNTIDQVYGFFNISKVKLKKRSITSEEYWLNGPYELIGWHSETYRKEILSGTYEKFKLDYGSQYNFTHVVEYKRLRGYFTYHGVNPSKFLNYVYNEKDCVYDNGKINIWNL